MNTTNNQTSTKTSDSKRFPIQLSAKASLLVDIVSSMLEITLLLLAILSPSKLFYFFLFFCLVESLKSRLFKFEKPDELVETRQKRAVFAVLLGEIGFLCFWGLIGKSLTLSPIVCFIVGIGLFVAVRMLELGMEIYNELQLKKLLNEESEDDADA